MKWLSLLFAYLPVVLQGITAVEATIEGATGASKKQVVMDIITNVAAAGEKIPEAHVQQISGLVDVVVGTLNKSGVFTSSTATAPKV
jgi:predicted AAA+ superfamily ATPase